MPSNHQTEEHTYGGQSFQPFEFDETVEPDLHDGSYDLEVSDVKARMSNPDKTTGVQYPQIVIEWKAVETHEDSEECRRSVGNTTSEFITLRPKGDRKGNMGKLRLTLLRNRFGIDSDVMPARLTSLADLDELRSAFKGQRTTGVVRNVIGNDGQARTNIVLEAAPAEAAADEEEVEEAPKPAKKAAQAKAAPAKKPARR